MGQQFYVIRRNPTPGSEADRLLKERRARKAAAKGIVLEDETTAAPETDRPKGQRQQPVRKDRARPRPTGTSGAAGSAGTAGRPSAGATGTSGTPRAGSAGKTGSAGRAGAAAGAGSTKPGSAAGAKGAGTRTAGATGKARPAGSGAGAAGGARPARARRLDTRHGVGRRRQGCAPGRCEGPTARRNEAEGHIEWRDAARGRHREDVRRGRVAAGRRGRREPAGRAVTRGSAAVDQETSMTETTPEETPAVEEGGLTRRLEEEGEIAADYLEELLDIADLDGDIDIDVDHARAVGGDRRGGLVGSGPEAARRSRRRGARRPPGAHSAGGAVPDR